MRPYAFDSAAEGIEAILETYDDIKVIATLSNGRDAIEQADALNPDVVLLDLNMPGVTGLSATEMILERQPDMRIPIQVAPWARIRSGLGNGASNVRRPNPVRLVERVL